MDVIISLSVASIFLALATQDVCITPDGNGNIPDCASEIRFPVYSKEHRATCGLGEVVFSIDQNQGGSRAFNVDVDGSSYSEVLNTHLSYAFSLYPTEPILERIACNASDFDLLLEFTLVRRMSNGPYTGNGEPPSWRPLAWNLATYTVAIKDQEIAFDELEDWGEPALRGRLDGRDSSAFLGELVRSSEYSQYHDIVDLPLFPRP